MFEGYLPIYKFYQKIYHALTFFRPRRPRPKRRTTPKPPNDWVNTAQASNTNNDNDVIRNDNNNVNVNVLRPTQTTNNNNNNNNANRQQQQLDGGPGGPSQSQFGERGGTG